MRFSDNRLYIERYLKCANCGVLLYGDGTASEVEGRAQQYCSDWCIAWQRTKAREPGFFRLPRPRDAGAKRSGGDDMVTLKIVEGNLASICRDMGITVMRTAYSPIFSESLDFTCGLFDTTGDMIAVGDFCPSMIGGMPLIIKTIVREIPLEEIEEGDVIVHNDPYRGGMHMPEHTFIKPVFIAGRLIGFSGAIGHVGEIGGMVPGSFFAEATEIFSEGLRVPPVKIRVKGRDNLDVWRLMLANVRTPAINHGDYRALIAAVDLGERRLQELVARHGRDAFEATVRDLLDYAEARMRAEIREIPDGRYVFEDFMEDDGITADRLRIHVELFIQGDEAVVDYGGTAPQCRGPINTPLSIPQAASYNAFLQLADLSIPKNSGCFRPIKVVVPPGSMLNVEFPAPSVGGNTECHPRIVYCVLGALAQALPGRVPAADGGTWSNFLFGGTHPETGDYYTCYDIHTVGWGGRPSADGNDAVGSMNGNCRTIPVEVYETRYPWLVEELALIADSGGAGEFRGGLGTRKTLLCRSPEIVISHVGDRHQIAPWGLSGGKPAGLASTLFRPAGRNDWGTACSTFGKVSPSKFANVRLHDGDRVQIATPGGGGWGEPQRRPAEKVKEDVSEGYVTEEAAARDYGARESRVSKKAG